MCKMEKEFYFYAKYLCNTRKNYLHDNQSPTKWYQKNFTTNTEVSILEIDPMALVL